MLYTNTAAFFAKVAVDYQLVVFPQREDFIFARNQTTNNKISLYTDPENTILYDMIQDGYCQLTAKATMPVFYRTDKVIPNPESDTFASTHFLSNQLFELLLNDNRIIDAQKGGLVLGNSHAQGGIQMIQKDSHGYRIVGEMEGYEYLINPTSLKKCNLEIQLLNIETSRDFSYNPTYQIPDSITTINVSTNQILLLSSDSQYIVNATATEKHLHRLETINRWTHKPIPKIEKPKKKWFEFWKS